MEAAAFGQEHRKIKKEKKNQKNKLAKSRFKTLKNSSTMLMCPSCALGILIQPVLS